GEGECGDGPRAHPVGRIARVAQLVEHTLGKGEVTGSIPVASFRRYRINDVNGRGDACVAPTANETRAGATHASPQQRTEQRESRTPWRRRNLSGRSRT